MARKKKKDPTVTPDSPHGSHIEFGTDQLRDALSLLRPVMYRRAVRKDYASYHIVARPNVKTVAIGVVGQYARLQVAVTPLALDGWGTVMIDAHALNMMLDAWAEPRIRVHLGQARPGEVELSWFQSKVTVNAFDPEKELRETAEPSLATSGFLIDARDLIRAIHRTRFATDESSSRYALGGLFLDATEPSRITVVATDGRRLAKTMIPAVAHGEPATHTTPPREFKGYTDGIPVVQVRAMALVEKLARREGVARVGFSILPGRLDLEKEKFEPARVQFVTPEAVVTCKLLEGRFPRYQDVFPAGPPACEARIDNAERLRSLLALATAASGSESKGVEMTMAGGCIMLWSESEHKAKAQLSLTEVDMTGQCSVTLDALLFRQMLDVLGHDPITIKWFGPKDAILLSSGARWEAAIMPLTRDEPPTPVPAEEPQEIEGNPDDFDPYGPSHVDGEGPDDEGGNVPVVPTEPETPVPVATEPETVKANGHAKPPQNGRPKAK